MTLHIEMIQETMGSIDLNDTMIPKDIIKAINETVHDQLIASRDTSREAQTVSEITHTIVLTAHAHGVIFHFGDRRLH